MVVCSDKHGAKWLIFTSLDQAPVNNSCPTFPRSKTKRLSCACLSVFLVIGHLSLSPFWTCSYLLTYPGFPSPQCAPAWMSRWCCCAKGRGRAALTSSFFSAFVFFCFFLGLHVFVFAFLLHCYSKMMCTQYPMYSFSSSIPRECLFSSYFTVVLPVFFPSLHILLYCTMVSDLVMYAPHPFDPPCSPMLCTLHNHPLLGAHLSSPLPYHALSHTFSPTFLHAILLLWQQSRSSLVLFPVHLPFFNSESKP